MCPIWGKMMFSASNIFNVRQSQNFLSLHDNLFLGGPVDQPGNEGEHLLVNRMIVRLAVAQPTKLREVAGSNPARSTNFEL